MEIGREGQRVKVEWGEMVDSEKNVSKSRKVAGAGSDPLVKYTLRRLGMRHFRALFNDSIPSLLNLHPFLDGRRS
jgi:hypothetical protein